MLFGDTIGSWIKWIVTLVGTIISAIWTVFKYQRDNKVKLRFELRNGITERDRIGGELLKKGITINVMNFGSIGMKVKLIGIGEYHTKATMFFRHILLELLNSFSANLKCIEKLNITTYISSTMLLQQSECRYEDVRPNEAVEIMMDLDDLEESLKLVVKDRSSNHINKNVFSAYLKTYDGRIYQQKIIFDKDEKLLNKIHE